MTTCQKDFFPNDDLPGGSKQRLNILLQTTTVERFDLLY